MKQNNVLLIGNPLTYGLIDNEILKANEIIPIYSYRKEYQTNVSSNEHSVFYNELSLEEFAKIIEQTRPDAIVCYNDNFLIQTARLREKFNIPGMGNKEIKRFKIKSQMYHALDGVIPTPKTVKINSLTTLGLIKDILGEGEYFIKPDNLAGSEGTAHINSVKVLENWFKKADLDSCSYLIQKYYNLPLVHCELYMHQSNVKYIQARRYSYPNHMFLQGKIISSFPIEDFNLREKIENATKEVAKALNYINGVMHTEFFLNYDETLIFLETNIRQAGGAINLIHKKRSGLSMETAMVLLELGKLLALKEDFSGYESCGYIPMKQGKVIGIELPKLKGHYHFDVRVKVGDSCQRPISASNTSIAYWGGSDNYNDLLDDFRWLENNSIIKYQNVR